MRIIVLEILLVLSLVGCAPDSGPACDPTGSSRVDQGVRRMIDDISRDLARDGPAAWTRYFLDGPEFHMVSDGKLVFATLDDAKEFLAGFAPGVSHMSLAWSDIRVDPAGEGLDVVAAACREVIQKVSGTELRFGGYFTGVVTETRSGWRLRTLRWSSPRTEP